MAGPDLQLLSNDEGDLIKRSQVMLRYLQDHGKLDGETVDITGTANKAGNAAYRSVQDKAGVNWWHRNVTDWDGTNEGLEALKARFLAEYNKNTGKHFDPSDDNSLLAAQNGAYTEILKAQHKAGQSTGSLLKTDGQLTSDWWNTGPTTFGEIFTGGETRERAVRDVTANQVMLRYLQDNDGLGGDRVQITGQSNKSGEAALKLMASQADGVDANSSSAVEKALQNRFIAAYNSKNNTFYTPGNHDQVITAVNQTFDAYMGQSDQPGIRSHSAVLAQQNNAKPEDKDKVADPTDNELAAMNRINKDNGLKTYTDDELKKLNAAQKTAMVAEFERGINQNLSLSEADGGDPKLKALFKDERLRTDGKMDETVRLTIGQMDDTYFAQRAQEKEQGTQQAQVTSSGNGQSSASITTGNKAGIREKSHRVGLAQTMLADQGLVLNFQKFGMDDKNGDLTGQDLVAYKQKYNAAHQGGPQLAVNADLDADTFKALTTDYLAAHKGITDQTTLEASIQQTKDALSQKFGRGEVPDGRNYTASTSTTSSGPGQSSSLHMSEIDQAVQANLNQLAASGTDAAGIQAAAKLLQKVQLAENGQHPDFSAADISAIKQDLIAYRQAAGQTETASLQTGLPGNRGTSQTLGH